MGNNPLLKVIMVYKIYGIAHDVFHGGQTCNQRGPMGLDGLLTKLKASHL